VRIEVNQMNSGKAADMLVKQKRSSWRMDGAINLILKGQNCIKKKRPKLLFFLTNLKIKNLFFKCGTDIGPKYKR
jgi:hypothetical protein